MIRLENNKNAIDQTSSLCKALSDPGRLKALAVLSRGELCLCQITDLLGLAPATVSRHMSVLHDAGLVEMRKVGQWHHYCLACDGPDNPEFINSAINLVLEYLESDSQLQKQLDKFCKTCCTPAPGSAPAPGSSGG